MKYISFLSILFSLSFSLTSSVLSAQEDPIFHCPEVGDYAFEGESQPTLCQRYYSISCDVQLGVGTPYPKSSLFGPSVSGNVCIIGDFEIDAPFSFIDAIVKIEPGVMIELKSSAAPGGPNGSLLLDNAKLFACEGMWKGIYLSPMSSITTKGGTWIEDAEKAIYATGFSTLYVQSTRFNRNWIGMELDGSLFAPILFVFSQNQFTCTSPLSMSGVSEIGYAGVVLKNASLFTQSNFNLFSDMRYGIYAQGSTSSIGASNLTMLRLRDAGIYMEEAILNLRNSYFGIRHYGINIGLAKLVNVRNTDFVIANLPTTLIRTGAYIERFALNSNVSFSGITFSADMQGTTNKVVGLHLRGGNVSAGTKIRISGQSNFLMRARDSRAIYLDGLFPSSSTTEIWNNHFKISTVTGDQSRPQGILVDGGHKNNLSIKWNTFTSYEDENIPQWGTGIELRNNSLGEKNEINVNAFSDVNDNLLQYIIARNFQNVLYCSNTFSGFGGIDFEFWGNCANTALTGNIITGTGYGIVIRPEAIIGQQKHQGNQWRDIVFPNFAYGPVYHAWCLGDPSLNKFTVHTPQSTCNQDPVCFNPYHPQRIEPDVMDEFFEQDSEGTPAEGCNEEFWEGETDNLDRQIAQGTLMAPFDDPVLAWGLKRYLYHKLKRNSDIVSEHPSFASFMLNEENSTIGKFYEVHAAIEDALKASADLDVLSAQVISDINGLMEDISDVDMAIEQDGLTEALKLQKKVLLLHLQDLYYIYDSVQMVYGNQVALGLELAYNLNESVTAVQSYEANEKMVNQIHLVSLMQLGGSLSESQVAILQSIAQQDPDQGGSAVYVALGMLPECARPSVFYEYSAISDGRILESSQLIEDRNNTITTQEELGLSISPNPVRSFLVVRNPAGRSGILTLFDISGRLLLQQHFTGLETRINLSAGLPSGVYFLQFNTEEGSRFFRRIVVQSN